MEHHRLNEAVNAYFGEVAGIKKRPIERRIHRLDVKIDECKNYIARAFERQNKDVASVTCPELVTAIRNRTTDPERYEKFIQSLHDEEADEMECFTVIINLLEKSILRAHLLRDLAMETEQEKAQTDTKDANDDGEEALIDQGGSSWHKFDHALITYLESDGKRELAKLLSRGACGQA